MQIRDYWKKVLEVPFDIEMQMRSPKDQMSRILGYKIPPFARCRSTPRRNLGPVIQSDEEVVPLGDRKSVV
jgi:hypothetical protein